MPKTVMIINYEYPPIGGGAATQAKYLTEGLARKGYHVVVLTSLFGDTKAYESISDNLEIYRVRSYRRSLGECSIWGMISFVLFAFLKIPELMKTHTPDVCITFFGIPCGPLSYFINKIYKVPYILCLRGGDVPGAVDIVDKYHKYLNPLSRIIWNNASIITTNSHKLKRIASEFLGDIKIDVVYNGVDDNVFFPQPDLREPKSILYAGRLDIEKNLEFMFLEVIPAVIKEDSDTIFTIVGDGPQRSRLEEIVEIKGLESNVNFIGWVGRDSIASEYNRHSLFILPSLSEGMSNVLLEAKACGLTCCAVDIPENYELLEEGRDLIVAPDKMTDAILGYLQSELKSGVAHEFTKTFAVRNMVQKYEQIFKTIIK